MTRKQFVIPGMQTEQQCIELQQALAKHTGIQIHALGNGLADISYTHETEVEQVLKAAGYLIPANDTGELLRYRTNINCEGCIARVGPVLDALAGAGNWRVDTGDRNKILYVQAKDIQAAAITEAVISAGFRAEPVY